MTEAKLSFEMLCILRKKGHKFKYIYITLSHYISNSEFHVLHVQNALVLFSQFGISLGDQLKFRELCIYVLELGLASDVSGRSAKINLEHLITLTTKLNIQLEQYKNFHKIGFNLHYVGFLLLCRMR
jgi:hypothetical protein